MATRKELARSEVITQVFAALANELAACEFLESKRWGDSPKCPNCDSSNVYKMQSATGGRNADFRWRCRECKKMYSIRTGTVLECSRLPLAVWVRALGEVAQCKNGLSALEVCRKYQIHYRSARFLLNRFRWAMVEQDTEKLDGVVEVDEVFIGGSPKRPNMFNPRGRFPRPKPKTPVVAVVQRNGKVSTRVMASVNSQNVGEFMREIIDSSAIIHTDAAPLYITPGRDFAEHKRVNHFIGEYAWQSDHSVHTNTAESFFARVRRCLDGVHVAVSIKHLPRYLAACAFAQETTKMNDGQRVVELFRRCQGKRLTRSETLS